MDYKLHVMKVVHQCFGLYKWGVCDVMPTTTEISLKRWQYQTLPFYEHEGVIIPGNLGHLLCTYVHKQMTFPHEQLSSPQQLMIHSKSSVQQKYTHDLHLSFPLSSVLYDSSSFITFTRIVISHIREERGPRHLHLWLTQNSITHVSHRYRTQPIWTTCFQ